MTTDWYLFWQQHYERPMVSEWDLYVAIISAQLQHAANVLNRSFIPAFTKSIESITDAIKKADALRRAA